MSTHSGAQNADKANLSSRGADVNSYWCLVIVGLPKYYGSNESNCNYLSETERPYVAAMVSQFQHAGLGEAIFDIQTRLQISKSGAWIKTPIFQLCQLFCSEKDEKCTTTTAHSLVGEHFAHLVHERQQDQDAWKHVLKRLDGDRLLFCVQMVVPKEEPLLFLALLSWKTDFISSNGGLGHIFLW
jgi:hypothetical protein